MKRFLLVIVALTLCFCATAQTAVTPDDNAGWSATVNRLQARLSFSRSGN
jgi:opacity protein-like surface antigen